MTLSKRIILLLIAVLVAGFNAHAQVDLEAEFFSLPQEVTDEYLDSMTVRKVQPNDYWMVGAYGGVSFNYGFFNPNRLVRWQMQYPLLGFSFVRYYTMFGIFPNMGLEFGAQLNHEGYEFKVNKENGYRATESGAYKIGIRVPEAFFLTHFHGDIGQYFKLMAKIGIYAGYRLDITRTLDDAFAPYPTYQAYVNTFRDYDRRWTFGVQGGAGFALMFDPFEFHVTVQVKWGWNSFWLPNYASQYYYRFAYPLDLGLTFGVYYQLTPRFGHTRAQLRKLARQMIEEEKYHENP
ncbi:MAG: hypothetical protein J5669_04885 [Bacteroidales bacterium]|nr:hypothetical protein [Bacteroidales bacterium]